MTSRPTELLSRIAVDPRICHDQPCVRGTRIMVWLVVQYMANGDSIDDILAAYPSLTREDIQACLAYAAELTRERVIPVEAESEPAVQAG
jgi:uncharacterized protein (DUF433 family)